ncbi:MAG: FtsQ-type POTRA domain-containing protein [Clostridia bacterium]|nr:FtsQ-type POTRA domain-containing protein [Clostridia bacterium]
MEIENQGNGTAERLTPEERHERVKKLKRKRKIRKAIVITAFVLIACVILSPVLLFAVFRVKDFAIEGETSYSTEEIVAASGISYGKSIFFADLDEAKVNIEKKLPYVNNVQLARRLPGTVVVSLESTSKAYAMEKSEGIYVITNSDFKVLEITGIMPKGVVPVIGAIPQKAELGETMSFVADEEQIDATLNLIKNISSAVSDSGLNGINLINIRSRSNIYIVYQERIVLRLGDSGDIDKKISLAKKVIEREDSIVNNEQSGIINLTVSMKAYFNPTDVKDIPEMDEYKNYVASNEKDSVEEAFAVECSNGAYAITNPAFKVLDFTQEVPEGIIPIKGYHPDNAKTGVILSYGDSENTKTAHNLIRNVTDAVSESGLKKVSVIGFDSDNNFYVICDERIVLRVGTVNNLEGKLAKAKSLIADAESDAIGVIVLDNLDEAEFKETEYEEIPELTAYKPLESDADKDN